MDLLGLLNGLPTVVEQGFILGIMALGVYITYSVLDFPDLSVDYVYPFGAFLVAYFLSDKMGFDYGTSMLVSFLIGTLAGLYTGILHVYLKIDKLLSGILVMISFYSINLRIFGTSNVTVDKDTRIFEILKNDDVTIYLIIILILLTIIKIIMDYFSVRNNILIFSSIGYIIFTTLMILLNGITAENDILITTIFVIGVKIVLDYILMTKYGFALRALGDNETLVVGLGVNEKILKISGLMIASGMVTLAGTLYAQYNGFADLSMGPGTIVIGLASIIIGTGIVRKGKYIKETTSVIIGSLVYQAIIYLALNTDKIIGIELFKPGDLKIITAFIVIFILGLKSFNLPKLRGGDKDA